MRHFFALLLALWCAWGGNAWGRGGRHVTPQQGAQPRTVVMISLDGFRSDYTEWYDTPFLDSIAAVGVRSGLIPSYPSKTFANHYTIATGLYPDHHGLVANSFFDPQTGGHFSLSDPTTKKDPRYYGGEPIWLTAQRQGLRTAVFYWPGSDVKVQGRYPDTYYDYDAQPHLTFAQRVDGIVEQLSRPVGQRPRLVMAYFEQPDGSGHEHGPQSKLTRRAVEQVDSLLGSLHRRVRQLPGGEAVDFIFLSDHGMAWVARDHQVTLQGRLRPEWVRAVEGSIPASIYCREGCVDSVYQALRRLDHVRVWRRQDIPATLHYGTNARIGDVVVSPDLGYAVYDGPASEGGNHGFDPSMQAMHALFRAAGPSFRHADLPHFRNVDVYPLVCRLLGITPAQCDGDVGEVETMLK